MFKNRTTDFLNMNSVEDLLEKYQSPLLVFEENTIKRKYKEMKNILDSLYPQIQIAYSVKTNYLPALITILKGCGASAEVVSGFEYWLVKKLHFKPGEIIFNGPDKSQSDIREALITGVMVHIDNMDELTAFLSEEYSNEKVKIGFRINTNLCPFSQRRFGFNVENGEVFRAVGKLKEKNPQHTISGLHIHLGSIIDDPARYTKAVESLSYCAIVIEKKWGDNIEYLDIGGGFPVQGARLGRRISWDSPGIKVYLKNITDVLNKKFPKDKPRLIVEPGRYLIDEAGVFITTVVSTKLTELLKNARGASNLRSMMLGNFRESSRLVQVVTVDTSRTSIIKYRSDSKHIQVLSKNTNLESKIYPTYIVGNSCIIYDYFTKEIEFSRVSRGDRILFSNAGAYTISRSEQFVYPRPAVVLIKENGDIECIRKREKYEDMVNLSV